MGGKNWFGEVDSGDLDAGMTTLPCSGKMGQELPGSLFSGLLAKAQRFRFGVRVEILPYPGILPGPGAQGSWAR